MFLDLFHLYILAISWAYVIFPNIEYIWKLKAVESTGINIE